MTIYSYINRSGIDITVERDGKPSHVVRGVFNTENSTGKRIINCLPDVDIRPGDWVVKRENERFYITDVISNDFLGNPYSVNAYYKTEAEYNESAQQATFNIQNAYGSIIGNQSHFSFTYTSNLDSLRSLVDKSDSADKQELQKLIDLVEMIVQNQVPASKGLLSRFSAVMERNSWLTSSILSALLGWLTTQIP